MRIVTKLISIVHSKKSNNHENKNKTMKLKEKYWMFNVSQLYSMPQFLWADFLEVNYNEQTFITKKEKKRDLLFYDQVPGRI